MALVDWGLIVWFSLLSIAKMNNVSF